MCVIPLMNTEIFSKYCFSDGMGKGEIYSILIFSRNRMSVPRKEEVGEGYKIIGNLSSLNLRIQCQKSFFFSRQQKVLCDKNISKAQGMVFLVQEYLLQQSYNRINRYVSSLGLYIIII